MEQKKQEVDIARVVGKWTIWQEINAGHAAYEERTDESNDLIITS